MGQGYEAKVMKVARGSKTLGTLARAGRSGMGQSLWARGRAIRSRTNQ